MDIERLKKLIQSENNNLWDYKEELLALIDEATQAYQPTISKTETTSCEWCNSGIDTASVMSVDMMMRFVRPVNYCPNCGRRLED